MSRHPWLRRGAAAILVAAVFFFLGREIYRDAAELRSFHWTIRPLLLTASLVMLPGVLLWGVGVWRLVIRRFGVEVPLRALARAWFLANLGRYIPGVVWQFVGLAQLGPSLGLTPLATITTLLANMGFSLLAATTVGVWLLPLHLAGRFALVVVLCRWASPLVLVLVHPAVIGWMLRLAGRATRRPAL